MTNHFDAFSLFVGTSGYSYGEWIDSGFYPQGTNSSNMLDIYTKFLISLSYYEVFGIIPNISKSRNKIGNLYNI